MILDGLLSPQECDELRQRMSEIVEEMDVPEHCRTTFSTYHDEQLKTQVSSCTLCSEMNPKQSQYSTFMYYISSSCLSSGHG